MKIFNFFGEKYQFKPEFYVKTFLTADLFN